MATSASLPLDFPMPPPFRYANPNATESNHFRFQPLPPVPQDHVPRERIQSTGQASRPRLPQQPPAVPRLELPAVGPPFNPHLSQIGPASPSLSSPRSSGYSSAYSSGDDRARFRRSPNREMPYYGMAMAAPSPPPAAPLPPPPPRQLHRMASDIESKSSYLAPKSPDHDVRVSTASSLSSLPLSYYQGDQRESVAPSSEEVYNGLELQWETIFDSRDHRLPILPPTWFQEDWEVVGVYHEHCLFIQKAEKKRKLQVFNIVENTLKMVQLKYDAAGLSFDGRHLLIAEGKVLSMLGVQTGKTLKKFKSKEAANVRKWTSNSRGFCWVDMEGRFWRWAYNTKSDPEMIFKLQASAPRHWLTPLTTPDGSWYAICATEKERRSGVVHCFPDDNGEARIFEGPSGATFHQVHVNGVTQWAVIVLTVGHAREGAHATLDIHGLERNAPKIYRHGRADVTIGHSMKLLPELHVDSSSSLVIAGVSTASADGALCLMFESTTGAFAASKRINKADTDRLSCGAPGMHLEVNACIFKRLQVHPYGLPRPDSAGTGAAPLGSRRSFDTWTTDSVSASVSGSTPPSGISPTLGRNKSRSGLTDSMSMKSPSSARLAAVNWGRGAFGGTAEDESWMLNR